MAQKIKIATFNVEWMVNLFETGKPELATKQNKKAPGLGAKPKNPQGVADRIAAVIKDVDADIVGICEGPPLKAQMQYFVKKKLGNKYTVYSMEDGLQSVHALVHKRLERDVEITQLPRTDKVYERLEDSRALYKWGDPETELKGRFTRLPVILRIKRKGKITEVMVVHMKSKISKLKTVKQWERRDAPAVVDAIFSRQKLSLQMNLVRKYIAHRLYSGNAEAVVVMGDMNDGITRDPIDDAYLMHNIVHELRGAFHHELALMRHVLTGKQMKKKSYGWTAEFRDPTNKGKPTRVLLDHILFSPACCNGGKCRFVKGSGAIEHEAFDNHVEKKGAKRDERPSDHKPLSAMFALT